MQIRGEFTLAAYLVQTQKMTHFFTLLAQPQGPHSDTLPALLLVLCLALPLVLLCRSSGRRSESKLEKLDDD
jgi:hypothetical protein